MYNRYIPSEGYQPVEREERPAHQDDRPGKGLLDRFMNLADTFVGKKKAGGFSGILDLLGLEQLDSGDILLILVLIYLFKESEDEEWLIILALVLFMGLG
jgi:hypothetical protein